MEANSSVTASADRYVIVDRRGELGDVCASRGVTQRRNRRASSMADRLPFLMIALVLRPATISHAEPADDDQASDERVGIASPGRTPVRESTMTRRLTLNGWRIVVGTVMGVVVGAAATSGFLATHDAEAAQQGGRGQAAPAAPLAPCGPKATLPDNLAKNVAPNSRCFEIRMYSADPSRDGVGQFKGGINELHQRFREREVELFVKHGAEIVGVWQHLGEPDTLVWMLAYRDRGHREEVWAAFGKDPDWDALRKKFFVPLKTNTFLMSASDYSPMK